jgi:hypothetical protein
LKGIPPLVYLALPHALFAEQLAGLGSFRLTAFWLLPVRIACISPFYDLVVPQTLQQRCSFGADLRAAVRTLVFAYGVPF